MESSGRMNWVTMYLRFLLCALLIGNAFAQTKGERLIAVIDQEVREITEIMKDGGSSYPELLLRRAELYLEKSKLIKEGENERFLALSTAQRSRVSRKKWFARSSRYRRLAVRDCSVIVKKYKNYRRLADVYYILAYHAQETGKKSKAVRYFKEASSRRAMRNSQATQRAQVSLAEIYYNDRRYAQAIPLYEKALRSTDSAWWTKDGVNLAWSYYRLKRHDKAIDLMKEVLRKSSSPRYIDMSREVLRDLGVFYADAGRVQEGITFYGQLGENLVGRLIKVGDDQFRKGRFTQAENIFQAVLKYSSSPADKMEARIRLLELYDQFGRNKQHLETARVLEQAFKRNLLNEKAKRILLFQVSKKASAFQQQVAKEAKSSSDRTGVKKDYGLAYLAILKTLRPGQRANTIFLEGETLYAAKRYTRAWDRYLQALPLANSTGLKSKIFDSLLSVAAKVKTLPDREVIAVYDAFWRTMPPSKRRTSIMKRLFNRYAKAKQYRKLEELSLQMGKEPLSAKDAKALVLTTIQGLDRAKLYAELARYVRAVEATPGLAFPGKARIIKETLVRLELVSAEGDLKVGNKAAAIENLKRIFESGQSSATSKDYAAYNLAVLYYEAHRAEDMHQWGKTSVSLASNRKFVEREVSYLGLLTRAFELQRLDLAQDLALRMLRKSCALKSKRRSIFFRNALILSVSPQAVQGAINALELGKSCNIPRVEMTKAVRSLFTQLTGMQNREAIEKLRATKMFGQLQLSERIVLLDMMYDDDERLLEWINRSIKKTAKNLDVQSKEILVRLKLKRPSATLARIKAVKLETNMERLPGEVEAMFKQINQLQTEVQSIQDIGAPVGGLKAASLLLDAYAHARANIYQIVQQATQAGQMNNVIEEISKLIPQIDDSSKTLIAQGRDYVVQNGILNAPAVFLDPNIVRIRPQSLLLDELQIAQRKGK